MTPLTNLFAAALIEVRIDDKLKPIAEIMKLLTEKTQNGKNFSIKRLEIEEGGRATIQYSLEHNLPIAIQAQGLFPVTWNISSNGDDFRVAENIQEFEPEWRHEVYSDIDRVLMDLFQFADKMNFKDPRFGTFDDDIAI
jgi:hypothetical protein